MAVEIGRVDAFKMREKIVDFFWDIKMWPCPTKEEYFRLWDWRFTSFSDGEPAVWTATDNGVVVGHVAVFVRELSFNGRKIRAGVLAHLRVSEPKNMGALGAVLANAPLVLLRHKEIDLLTGYGNGSAHRMVVALGSIDLGPMRTLVRVLKWPPVLKRRSVALGAVEPLARAIARGREIIRGAPPEVPPFLTARNLSAEEVHAIDRSHWRLSQTLTWNGSQSYFARRFCASEFNAGGVLGVIDSRSGKLEAFAAVSGSTQLMIIQCEVNEHSLSLPQAVEAVVRANPSAESVSIPLLPNTSVAREFRRAGYMQLPLALTDSVMRNTYWSARWLPHQPFGNALAQTDHWKLWYGWSHH